MHEFAHALMYAITYQKNDWLIRLGEGKKITTIVRIDFHQLPTTGYCKWGSYDSMYKIRNFMCLIAGPLISLLLVIVIFLMNKYVQNQAISSVYLNFEWVLGFGFWYNLYSFVFTLLPTRYQTGFNKGRDSDGLQILTLMKLKKKH